MDFPEFQNDDEMAAWFEANNVSAADLEIDPTVFVASDVTASLTLELFSMLPTQNHSGNAAPTLAEKRQLELTPN